MAWTYSTLGSIVFTAAMKLHHIHLRLGKLEIRNIRDYFNGPDTRNPFRRAFQKCGAFLMWYTGAIRRVVKLSRKARQDYFALNRHGCFSAAPSAAFTPKILSRPRDNNLNNLPLLIVPGLNTPPAFFREMYEFFTDRGHVVSVMTLPEKGFADIDTATQALDQEIIALKEQFGADQVNLIGHCLGGLIGHRFLSQYTAGAGQMPVRHLVSLGTGFRGAEGVRFLKELWIERNPGKQIPQVFDELIQGGSNIVHYAENVLCHNFLTVRDFIVHLQKGILENSPLGNVSNYIFDDPDIDHLTLALNPKVFRKIEQALSNATLLDASPA